MTSYFTSSMTSFKKGGIKTVGRLRLKISLDPMEEEICMWSPYTPILSTTEEISDWLENAYTVLDSSKEMPSKLFVWIFHFAFVYVHIYTV